MPMEQPAADAPRRKLHGLPQAQTSHNPRKGLAEAAYAASPPFAMQFTVTSAFHAQPESLVWLLRRYEDIFGLFRCGRLCLGVVWKHRFVCSEQRKPNHNCAAQRYSYRRQACSARGRESEASG